MSMRRWSEQSDVNEAQMPPAPKTLPAMLPSPQMMSHGRPKLTPQPFFDWKLQSSEMRAVASTAMRELGIWMSWSSPRRNSRSNAALVVRQ